MLTALAHPVYMLLALIVVALLAAAILLALSHRLNRLRDRVLEIGKSLSRLSSELEMQTFLSGQISLDIENLRTSSLQKADASMNTPGWSAGHLPFDLNKRGQIVRLSRKGKSVAEIASDLNVSQGKVDLLLKVHGLRQSAFGGGIQKKD